MEVFTGGAIDLWKKPAAHRNVKIDQGRNILPFFYIRVGKNATKIFEKPSFSLNIPLNILDKI